MEESSTLGGVIGKSDREQNVGSLSFLRTPVGTGIAVDGDDKEREKNRGTQLGDANVPCGIVGYGRQVRIHLPGNILHRSVRKEFRERLGRLYRECLAFDVHT